MPLPHDVDQRTWNRLLDQLDSEIEQAIQEYVQSRFLGASDIAAGYSELGKLRSGHNPDYTLPGVAVAYAFAYLPRRVTSVLGALTLISSRGMPRRVLDIGSGTDATSLAISLCAPQRKVTVVSVEPSPEMRGLAESLYCYEQVVRKHVESDLDGIVSGTAELSYSNFDLVVLSATLPYGDRDWNETADAIGRFTGPPSTIVAIGPSAKEALVDKLATGFDKTGWYERFDHCCHDLPGPVRIPRQLVRLTSLLRTYYPHILASRFLTSGGRALIGNPMFYVSSWNGQTRYKEVFRIFCEDPPNEDPVDPDDLPFD